MPRKKETNEIDVLENTQVDDSVRMQVEEVDNTEKEPEELPKDEGPLDSQRNSAENDNPAESAAEDTQKAVALPREYVHTISGGRSELTEAAKRRNDLIDLSESMKSRRIMTSKLHGIENPNGQLDTSYGVLYHGLFKVIIPSHELLLIDNEYADGGAGIGANITKRLGADIDFIVKGIDDNNDMAVASRLDAMAKKRRIFYQGEKRIRTGDLAEARIVSVFRKGIFVELFGAEVLIRAEELSYQRRFNAMDEYKTGDVILVRVIALDTSDMDNIYIELSVKQAAENMTVQMLERYNVGDRYVGTVSYISTSGIFVSLDDGLISCHCRFPAHHERPVKGAQVTVMIAGINMVERMIWGVITHW